MAEKTGNVKSMSAEISDDNGNLLKARLEETQDKLVEVETELSVRKLVEEIRDIVIELRTKVVIHNNYETRIRSLESNQWKILGIFTGITAITTTVAIGIVVAIFQFILK